MRSKIGGIMLGFEVAAVVVLAIEGGFSINGGPQSLAIALANGLAIAWLFLLAATAVNMIGNRKNAEASFFALLAYIGAALLSFFFIPTLPASHFSIEFNVAVVILALGCNLVALIDWIYQLTLRTK